MTIKEAASIAGVTPQAIYKRLKASGTPVDQLKTKDGTLTTDGLTLLASMFSALRDTMPHDEAAELRSQVELLTDEAAALRDSLQQAQARAAELAVKVELLTAERDHLRQVLDHEQQLHAALLAKLPALPADTSETRKKTHWWERLRK